MAQISRPLPRLRPVDARPHRLDGRDVIVLRDPLELGEGMLAVPRVLGPVLALLDGRTTRAGMHMALGASYGLRITNAQIDAVLERLDASYLLDNASFERAHGAALARYRAASSRPSALAGVAYPDAPDALRAALDGHLAAVGDVVPEGGDLRGVVSPHIDYERGAAVYARTWKRAAPAARAAEVVVVLGTDHHGGGDRLTLTRQSYATPYGVLPTDVEVVDALAEALAPEDPFEGELRHRGEHSIELAAVWLHHVRGGAPCDLVPVLTGSFAPYIDAANGAGSAARGIDEDPVYRAFLGALERATAGRRVLVVAAGDLSHVGPVFGGEPLDDGAREALAAVDDAVLTDIEQGDAAAFVDRIAGVGDRHNVCGLSPVYLTLRALGATRGERVDYAQCPADEDGTSVVSVCGVVLR